MNNEYLPIIEQAEKAGTQKEKMNCILSILSILTCNHLPHIEGSIKKIKRWLLLGLLIVLLTILFQDQLSLTHIISLIRIL